MNTVTENQVEIINDQIRINNDRVEGYEKAAAQIGETESSLRNEFLKMAQQSQGYAASLRQHVHGDDEVSADETTVAGKIYRTWMDVKAVFTGKDTKAILSSCEYGEDAAQKAYKTALENPEDLSSGISSLIQRQQAELKLSHDKIKALRDSQP